MSRRRILVIEDDTAIRQVVVDALAIEGYEAVAAASYPEGLRVGLGVPCDLALLDLVLPGGDGLDLLRELRAAWPSLPVIVLTARGREEERIAGLKLGADDYVVKPFSIKEMLARVEAVLRRSAERPDAGEEVRFTGGIADLARSELRFDDGARETLAEREVALLRYLAQRPGRLVSREELLSRVWHLKPGSVRTRTIDMHVARLREKLRAPSSIVTVRGKGYSFEPGEP